DGEHGGEAVWQEVRGRDPERDPRSLDLALAAYQSLRHRRLGDEAGARDPLGAEAPEGAQRQRHLRVCRERRVTAGEDQLEPLGRENRAPPLPPHPLRDIETL